MAFVPGGRIVAKALKAEGVSHLFTLCGGHVQMIYDGCLDEGIRVIDTRHEQSAAHAADGWARVTGQPGVVAVTAGPGITDAVTAIANAHRAQVPMVVLGGQAAQHWGYFGGKERGGLQEMNALELLRPVTKWAASVHESRRLGEYVQSAFRIATSGVPGPVFVEMPLDILMGGADDSEVIRYDGYRTEAQPLGDPEYIERAADLIRRAERPVLIVGSQWRWSRRSEGLRDFLDVASMPTYLNGMARGALPPGHPAIFKQGRSSALKRSDLAIVFGTPLDFRLGYGEKIPESAKLIQVDLDGAELGRNRRVDVGIVGDSGQVLSQLARVLEDRSPVWSGWLEEVGEIDEKASKAIEEDVRSDAEPIDPLRLCAEMNRFVDDKTIVIGDGGDFVATAAYMLDVDGKGHWMDPGPLGTLGVGPGYAMAAKLARPDHKVLLVLGDGSFGLNAMEFEAMARQGIDVVGVVGNDARWMQIFRGQVAMYGEERAVATTLNHTRYDKVVEALGGHGEYVEKPGDIRPALERAFSAGKPALVNVKIGESAFRKNALAV